MSRHAGAWLAWYVAALVVASSSVHPLVTLATIAAAIAVAVATTPRAERGPFRLLLTLGVCFIGLRVALFTLTGRAGATTLLDLPELRLPDLLGGLRIGGALSAEVAVHEFAEGLRLVAILAVTGAFVAVTDVVELIRLAPRRLRRTGMIVQIAVAFVPSLAVSAREVREAQRARGLRVRGIRSAVPLIVPVIAGALDRAFALAESLHARGFDRAHPSRYRPRRWASADTILAAIAGVAALLAIAAARTDAGAWSAYPNLRWPEVSPLLAVAPMLLFLHLPFTTRAPAPAMHAAEPRATAPEAVA